MSLAPDIFRISFDHFAKLVAAYDKGTPVHKFSGRLGRGHGGLQAAYSRISSCETFPLPESVSRERARHEPVSFHACARP
jgi:hypothetical protein